jgi:hypothetical protein
LKNFGFVPSVNGFGHTRRLLSLAIELTIMDYKCNFILPCILSSKSPILGIISEHGFDYEIICIRELNDGPFVLKNQSHECKSYDIELSLKKYEYLIADTVTWVSNFHSDTYLFAQFTWEQYHNRDTSDLDLNNKLIKYKKIFGFKYFTNQFIKSQINYQEIPLLDYWNLSRYSSLGNNGKFLIANSGAEDFKILTSNDQFLSETKISYGLEKHLKINSKPLAIICRPGLGAILESISAGIVPILLDSEDYELEFNKKVAIENGWAIDYKSIESLSDFNKVKFVENFKNLLTNPEIINPATLVRQFMGEFSR